MYKLILDAFLGPLQRSHKGQRCVKSGNFLPVTDRVGQVIDNFRDIFGLFAKQASALVQSLNRYPTDALHSYRIFSNSAYAKPDQLGGTVMSLTIILIAF